MPPSTSDLPHTIRITSHKYGSFIVYPQRIIETGHQADIVEGLDEVKQEKVVIKLSHAVPVGYSNDSKVDDKVHLLREANILKRLSGLPGIPEYKGIYRIVVSDTVERIAVVMQYIQGKSILQNAKKGHAHYTATQSLELLKKLAQTLQQIHDRGIVHCDLKFSNIMITEQDAIPYLVDWGSAEVIDSSKKHAKPIIGTIQFMPYEQLKGHPLDQRADIYSLGVIVSILTYGSLISQRYVLEGKKSKELPHDDLVQTILNGYPLKFHLVAPPKNNEEKVLLNLLYKMTAINRDQRYFSLQEVISELDKI